MNEFVPLSPDHARRLADGIEQHEASFITPKGDGWLTPTERRYIASLLRNAAASETQTQFVPVADYDGPMDGKFGKVTLPMQEVTPTSSERAQLLEDALDDVKRLHAEKMKFFERTIELERQLAAVSATSPSKDEARLRWLEKVLQHCPHAELTHNDDAEEGPVGWSLAIESCSRMDLQAPTLAALIDLGMNTEPDEDGDVVARSEGAGA